MDWFHGGSLTRDEAEDLIKSEGKEDGAFLVRESNSAIGDFVLTLYFKGEVIHYQIRRHGEDAFFSIDDTIKILHGLDTLVEFYRQDANGLVVKLGTHIKKELPPNDCRSHGVTNLLHRATKENNHTVVSELLKCGYRNFDAKNQDGQTAMHLAALHCDESMLDLLIKAGVNVNCMDTVGNLPIHYACRNKSASFVRNLIAANANVQGRNIKNGYVPLHEAAKHGNLNAVMELLDANAPLLPRTTSGEFPIDLAKEHQHEQVVAFLNSYKFKPAITFRSQWYHGTLNRTEATEALMAFANDMMKSQITNANNTNEPILDNNGNTDENSTNVEETDTSGCFLVRYSERSDAASGYVLTLMWNKNTKNFKICQSGKHLYIDDSPFLPSLEHLVEHFMRFSDGLPVKLKFPVRPQPKPPLPLFSTMPRANKKKLPISMPNSPQILEASGSLLSKQSQSVGATQKKIKDSVGGSVFNTVWHGAKPANIVDTFRRNKTHTKSATYKDAPKDDNQLIKTDVVGVLNSLTFSTNFSNLNKKAAAQAEPLETAASLPDGFYNVPRNNSVCTESADDNETKGKTETDIEYFTQSDVAIEHNRMQSAVEEPSSSYIATTMRVCFDGNTPIDELPEACFNTSGLGGVPGGNRGDATASIASNDSKMFTFLHDRNSNSSSSQSHFNYFVSPECLKLDSIIGEGEFGSVYKGYLITKQNETEQPTRTEVAIKTLRDEHCRKKNQEFLREASVMIRLKHHCIVRLIGISKGETLMMVQELVALGSMLHFILEHRDKINQNFELKLWASQIACGMQYLESHHFVHRDLAARNILLASRNQAKISDFGLSRALGTDNDCYQASQGGKWPIKWYAPESFNNGLFSHASDVWSFGVTLWEMFALGESPYGEMRGVDAIQLIESGHRLPQPKLCPDTTYEIMRNCWNYKPKDRPTFRYLTDFFGRDPDYENIVELIKTDHIN